MDRLIKYKGTTYLMSKFTFLKAQQANPRITKVEFNKLKGQETKKKDPVKDKKVD